MLGWLSASLGMAVLSSVIPPVLIEPWVLGVAVTQPHVPWWALALVVAVGLIIRKMVPQFRSMQTRIDTVNRVLREQISGVRVVRAFVREPVETERFGTANDELTATALRAGRLMVRMFPTVMLVLNCSIVALLWFGAYRVDSGAMQVASLAPRYVSSDDVPKDVLAKEREIIVAQTAEEKKPPEIVAKMVDGKLRKFVDEITLTGQVFVKDDKGKQRVRDVLAANKAKVKSFRRFEVGEGIEKKSADFVQEVMAQASQSR